MPQNTPENPIALSTGAATPPTIMATSEDIAARVAQMSLEEKVGQVMIIGFDGPALDADLRAMLTDYHIGGAILFARNVESPRQVAQLTNALQRAALESNHPGLILAIDQEGGRVARLTEATGFTEIPSAMALGATGNPETARAMARLLAQELRAVGLNTNFAPVLDVNNNPANPIIATRSFGSDPQRVAAFGVAYLEGLQSEGVLAFGKHFPGHGDTGVDSHVALPLVPHDRARLEAVEFVPFEAAIAANIAGIMSAHITFPAIEPTPGLAATLSPRVLTDLLRGELGYEGLLVTDSLEMKALGESLAARRAEFVNGDPTPLAAAIALQAGADLLLFNRDHALHRAAHGLIVAWVREGRIPESRLDEAVTRVLEAKARFGLLNPAPVDEKAAAARVGSAEHKALARAAAAQGITLVRDDGLLPLREGAPLLVIETPAAAGLGRALDATFVEISNAPTAKDIQLAQGMARDGRTVLVATTDIAHNPAQATLVAALLEARLPVIVVAMRSPYDLMAFPDAPTAIATYGSNPPTLEALIQVLRGEVQAQGRLPVDF